jgi:catechol 2,3-dioxygenase-like lactoylglutathione lyase family enzyme
MQIRVTDLERSLRFYTRTLGFQEEFRFQDFYAGIRAAGTSLHLKSIAVVDPSIRFVQEGDHCHLYLRVPDLDGTFRELEGKVDLVYPVTTKPWGDREFTIRDPDGHTIYLAEASPESVDER